MGPWVRAHSRDGMPQILDERKINEVRFTTLCSFRRNKIKIGYSVFIEVVVAELLYCGGVMKHF